MNKIVTFFILMLVSAYVFAAPPTGLTPDDSGTYYDPMYNGAGISLNVLDTEPQRIFATLYARPIAPWFDRATWFTIQGIPDDRGTLPLRVLMPNDHDAPWTWAPQYAVAGTITLHKDDDGTIDAKVVVWSDGFPQFSPRPAAFTLTMNLVRLL